MITYNERAEDLGMFAPMPHNNALVMQSGHVACFVPGGPFPLHRQLFHTYMGQYSAANDSNRKNREIRGPMFYRKRREGNYGTYRVAMVNQLINEQSSGITDSNS